MQYSIRTTATQYDTSSAKRVSNILTNYAIIASVNSTHCTFKYLESKLHFITRQIYIGDVDLKSTLK